MERKEQKNKKKYLKNVLLITLFKMTKESFYYKQRIDFPSLHHQLPIFKLNHMKKTEGNLNN